MTMCSLERKPDGHDKIRTIDRGDIRWVIDCDPIQAAHKRPRKDDVAVCVMSDAMHSFQARSQRRKVLL